MGQHFHRCRLFPKHQLPEVEASRLLLRHVVMSGGSTFVAIAVGGCHGIVEWAAAVGNVERLLSLSDGYQVLGIIRIDGIGVRCIYII